MGYLYAILASISWGLIVTIDQKILTKISAAGLLFIDSLLGILLTLPILFFDYDSIKQLFSAGRTNWLLIVFSFVLAIPARLLFLQSIKMLGASTASVFEITYPLFVIMFSFFFFKTSLNIYFLIVICLVFSGIYIIMKFCEAK